MNVYGFLADAVVAIHVAYVAFVVVGQLIILLGWILKWSWIRNCWFRLLHLLAIGIVAIESLHQIECPITVWEKRLREAAGQEVSEASFIGRCLHGMIFHNAPQVYFDIGNVVFCILVLITFFAVPPRLRSSRNRQNPGKIQPN